MDLFFDFFKRILINKTAFLNKVKCLIWSRFALFLLLKLVLIFFPASILNLN